MDCWLAEPLDGFPVVSKLAEGVIVWAEPGRDAPI